MVTDPGMKPTMDLNTQCMIVAEAMNAMAQGINRVLFIREIMPEDELLNDELEFKTSEALKMYLTLRNDMEFYRNKRDVLVKEQNFHLAADYLVKYKQKKKILHRAMQTLSFKSGKPYACTKLGAIVYFNPRIQG